MAVVKPRRRLVYFRVSEDEFQQFVRACEQHGARSLSDMARTAVRRLIADSNGTRDEQGMPSQMDTLEKLMLRVKDQLERLVAVRGDLQAMPIEDGSEGPRVSSARVDAAIRRTNPDQEV